MLGVGLAQTCDRLMALCRYCSTDAPRDVVVGIGARLRNMSSAGGVQQMLPEVWWLGLEPD